MRLPEEMEMLTPEPLEVKPHVYGKRGRGSKVTPAAIS